MKTLTRAFLLLIAVSLNACEALQPVAHVDSEGYAFGFRGTWKSAETQVAEMFHIDHPVYSKDN